jgi:hypothetical protein
MALCYGKPSSIPENDWQVGMISNIDDVSLRCPGFVSKELDDEGTYQVVTIASYQRYKFRLYKIAAPITKTIYFHRGATLREIVARVKDIHQQLIDWDHSIPPELRLGSFSATVDEGTPVPISKMFQLQALALQLSYDNIQLLLHRPLLAYTYGSCHSMLSETPAVDSSTQIPLDNTKSNRRTLCSDDDFYETTRSQCWQSSMRTSLIGNHPAVLREARNSHAAAYVGIQTFAAGVMLAMFALLDPLCDEARDAKTGIARLIETSKSIGGRASIIDQCGRILEGLLRLILTEEINSMLLKERVRIHPVSAAPAINREPSNSSRAWTPIGSAFAPTSFTPRPSHEGPEKSQTGPLGFFATPVAPNCGHPSESMHDQTSGEVLECAASADGADYLTSATSTFAEAQTSVQDGTMWYPAYT